MIWVSGREAWNETLVWDYRGGATTFTNLTAVGQYTTHAGRCMVMAALTPTPIALPSASTYTHRLHQP